MNKTQRNIESFKRGLLGMNTRRFGKVSEIMIMKLFNYKPSGTNEYDLYDTRKKRRIEVKFSRASKKHPSTITEANVIKQCISNSDLKNRYIDSDRIIGTSFDSNIQQVKKNNFDLLYYGLFFMDCIEIYSVTKAKVSKIPGYSDKQHAGNIGEGQFHLNESTIDYHRKKNKVQTLSYAELYNLLMQK